MSDLVCASFFAGVGGIDLGFRQAGFKTVYANELDENASKTFNINNDITMDNRSILDVSVDEIPDFDIMLGGFPCQAFSVAGLQQGFNDEKGRGILFFELERIFLVKKPKVIFLENVKNLVSHDGYNTLKVVMDKLSDAGYHVKSQVLNTCDYANLPQNRERIFIVGFLDEEAWFNFQFPLPITRTTKLGDVVDFGNKVPDKYYLTKDSFKNYDVVNAGITKNDTAYEWRRSYLRENKSKMSPTLMAIMGSGGCTVPLIRAEHGLRKFTPRECFLLQGYPEDFKFPEGMVDSHLYKQAGNSVTVPVIRRIAEEIRGAL